MSSHISPTLLDSHDNNITPQQIGPDWSRLENHISHNNNGCRYSKNTDIWISPDKKSVKWCKGKQCQRRFNYNRPIVNSGFIDFEKIKNCFIIILEDLAHVYFLDNGSSTTVCFPFPISSAVWYINGIILERKLSISFLGSVTTSIQSYDSIGMDLKHRFITLTDPFAPFGFISFNDTDRNKKKNKSNDNNNINNNIMNANMHLNNVIPNNNNNDISQGLNLLSFPNIKDQNIAVFWDQDLLNLQFYYVRIIPSNESERKTMNSYNNQSINSNVNSNSNSNSITNNNVEIDTNSFGKKNLRKFSILNRRTTSLTLNIHDFPLPTNNISSTSNTNNNNNNLTNSNSNANINNNGMSSINASINSTSSAINNTGNTNNNNTNSNTNTNNSNSNNNNNSNSSNNNNNNNNNNTTTTNSNNNNNIIAANSGDENIPTNDLNNLVRDNDIFAIQTSSSNAGTIQSSLSAPSKRSLSATLDRMGNTSIRSTGSAISPLDFRVNSGSFSPMSPLQQQQQQLDYLNQSISSSKDIILTKISSMTLPSGIIRKDSNSNMNINTNIDTNISLKCFSLKFGDQEAIIMFDERTRFSKIWLINLIPDIINGISFKVYGNSPADLIGLSNLNFKDTSKVEKIYHFNYCPLLSGVLLISFSTKNNDTREICLYNPFLGISSPRYTLSKEKISQDELSRLENFFPSPGSTAMLSCFQVLKWILSPSIYLSLQFLWQYIYLQLREDNINKNEYTTNNKFGLEFRAIQLILTDLISVPSQTTMFTSNNLNQALNNLNLFQNLKNNTAVTNNIVPKIILGLHLLREEFSLNILRKNEYSQLGNFLYFVSRDMGWPEQWTRYYLDSIDNEMTKNISFNHTNISLENTNISSDNISNPAFAHPLDAPPSILQSLYSITEHSVIPITPFISFSKLVEADSQLDLLLMPRSFKLLRLYELIHSSTFTLPLIVDALSKLDIPLEELKTYPLGILDPLENMLDQLDEQLSLVDVNISNYDIIGRQDMANCVEIIKKMKNNTSQERNKNIDISNNTTSSNIFSTNLAKSNIKKKPDNIISIVADIIKKANNTSIDHSSDLISDFKDVEDVDEGFTLKENSKLIFSEDNRFTNVISLLAYYKPHYVQFFTIKTEYYDILVQKKYFAQCIALRTCSNGIGMGAVAYATEKPLSTQKLPIRPLNLTFLFPDNTEIKVAVPDELGNDIFQWGQFHIGVSTGLTISKKTTGITGSWIAFNKPKEMNSQYGGFLLGLGLNGHLKNLEEWHIYNCLSPIMTHISIGLLLGMSASMKGTMDSKLTKVISVHLAALLPVGSSDLNIDVKLQTAGLISVGMLYQNSRHKRMSDLIFEQFESLITINDERIANEEYRMAAGIALGLINLGVGETEPVEEDSFVLKPHLNVKDSLENIVLGQEGVGKELTGKLLDIITQRYDIEQEWIPENSQIGAVLALTFMFLKSGNTKIADILRVNLKSLPKTNMTCRPELFMYKEWATHMICWDNISGNLAFLLKDVDGSMDFQYLNTDQLPIYYTMAGRILAVGIKFASTGDTKVRDALLSLVDKFLPFYQYPGDARVDFKLTISVICTLVNVILVSASMVMCATGDLEVFRRINYIHEIVSGNNTDLYSKLPSVNKAMDDELVTENIESQSEQRNDDENDNVDQTSNIASPDNSLNEETDIPDPTADVDLKKEAEPRYARYIASNLSLGFLFLGSGQYALQTSSLENIAYLMMAVLPTYGSPCQLQELKHFWSMSVEPRCLVVKNIFTGEAINRVPIELVVSSSADREDTIKKMTTPCLLPDFRKIKSIRINSPDYYPLEMDFTKGLTAVEVFNNGTIIQLQPKTHDNFKRKKREFNSTEDIQEVLKKKIDATKENILNYPVKLKEDQTAPSTDILKSINVTDLTMVELDSNFSNKYTQESSSNVYNLNMLCSDSHSGNIIDYQLEYWKKKYFSSTGLS